MHTINTGADTRHSNRPDDRKGTRQNFYSPADKSGILSTLELRRLVATMVD